MYFLPQGVLKFKSAPWEAVSSLSPLVSEENWDGDCEPFEESVCQGLTYFTTLSQ